MYNTIKSANKKVAKDLEYMKDVLKINFNETENIYCKINNLAEKYIESKNDDPYYKKYKINALSNDKEIAKEVINNFLEFIKEKL
jgi:hypothetical protein